MRPAPAHRRIEEIEARIAQLRERAATLLEREHQTEERLRELKLLAETSTGRLKAVRLRRVAGRTERRLERLRIERAQLVEQQIRSILLSLQEQSSRTRQRLDRELGRLEPLEQEWERLRALFDALQQTIATPAVEKLATRWQGQLEIPDFPVQEHQGYVKPFPAQAILF